MTIKTFWKKNKLIIAGIWGVSTTLLSLYWAIYPLKQNAKLTYYQKSKVDVFNIDDPIDELQIVLNGKDIRKDNLNLRVYKFKVANDGDRDIRQSDYVKEIPFGLKVESGKIARVNITKANNTTSILKGLTNDSTFAHFNPVFIGENEYITFDVWVVHKKNTDPKIIPRGRIADTKIELSDSVEEGISKLEEFRQIYILIGKMLLFFIPVLILVYLLQYLKKKYKMHRMKTKYDVDYDVSNKSQKTLIKFYLTLKESEFLETLKSLLDKDKLDKLYEETSNIEENIERFYELVEQNKNILVNDRRKKHAIYFDSPFWDLITTLIDSELATETPGKGISIDTDFVRQAKLTLKVFEVDQD